MPERKFYYGFDERVFYILAGAVVLFAILFLTGNIGHDNGSYTKGVTETEQKYSGYLSPVQVQDVKNNLNTTWQGKVNDAKNGINLEGYKSPDEVQKIENDLNASWQKKIKSGSDAGGSGASNTEATAMKIQDFEDWMSKKANIKTNADTVMVWSKSDAQVYINDHWDSRKNLQTNVDNLGTALNDEYSGDTIVNMFLQAKAVYVLTYSGDSFPSLLTDNNARLYKAADDGTLSLVNGKPTVNGADLVS